MSNKNQFSVAIPIYKIKLSNFEKQSLHQCLSILGKYTISFVHPNSFNFEKFCQINDIDQDNYYFKNIAFEDEYFKGISGYNRLLLSELFYTSFQNFEYILIYQLDAWVFKDEIKFWISQNYDYIGAPWIDLNYKTPWSNLHGVGNGGFSLRRVNTFIKVLRSYKFYILPCKDFQILWSEYRKNLLEFNDDFKFRNRLIVLIKCLIRMFGYQNNLSFYRSFKINEDIFWSVYVPKVFKDFYIPSVDIASQFAIETSPEERMKSISPELPFGCHAWEKWNREFWKHYIKALH